MLGEGNKEVEKEKQEVLKARIRDSLRERFKPEFLNRLDDVVVFNTLTQFDLLKVVDLELESVGERLRERHVKLQVAPAAKELLVKEGFDPQFGARPLKRTVETLVLNALAKDLISGKVRDGDTVKVDAKDGHIVFSPPLRRVATTKAAHARGASLRR